MDEDLETAPVFKNLNYNWSFYGLQLFHFAIAGVLGTVTLFASVLIGFNLLYAVAIFLAASAGLAALQWRKPAHYLPDLFLTLVLPRHLTCLVDDDITWPFPVAPEDLRR
jgi:hypothetical protein